MEYRDYFAFVAYRTIYMARRELLVDGSVIVNQAKAQDMSVDNERRPLDADLGAQLIDMAGGPQFAETLLAISESAAGVAELFGYVIFEGEDPEPLVSASRLPDREKRVEEYARRFYRHDPTVYEQKRLSVGSGFSQRVRMKDIVQKDYRTLCFERPQFAEKLSFGWRGADRLMVLSFYRRSEADELALARLASIADLTLSALNRRIAKRAPDEFVGLLEARLTSAFPLLTTRERQVAARTIAGWTSGQSALALNVSAGTILSYRQRAYQKYGLSSAADFLPFLM
jgi:DNA-binding CsgD family transcriptional regulator